MKSIHRFEIGSETKTALMPIGAEILDVTLSKEFRNRFDIWAIVDTDVELKERTFDAFVAGSHIIEESGTLHHIKSLRRTDTDVMVHIFEFVGLRK